MNDPTPEEIEYMKEQIELAKEIAEGNNIIAEFIGDKPSYKPLNLPGNWEKVMDILYPIEQYDYRYSWEALMHAVEYIEKLGFLVDIKGTNCIIQLHNCESYGVDEGDKRLSTWTCIVEFIKGKMYKNDSDN